MNNYNQQQTTPLSLNHNQSASLANFLEQMRLADSQSQGDKLRWVRALDPSPVWQRLIAYTYEKANMMLERWSIGTFLYKVGVTYNIWYPNTLKDLSINLISRGAILAILISNPTKTNVGLYLVHLCCDLKIDVSEVVKSLVSLLASALEKGISSLKQLIEKVISLLTITTSNESEESFEASACGTIDIYESILVIVSAIVSTVKDVCNSTLLTSLGSCVKSINMLAQGGKSVEYLYTMVRNGINLLVSCICPDREIVALAQFLQGFVLKLDGKDALVSDFLMEITNRSTSGACQAMKKDVEFLRSSKQLLDDAKLCYLDMKGSTKVLFSVMLKKLEAVVLEATSQTTINTRKFEPYFFCMAGEPGLGKSVAVNLLMSMLGKHFSAHPEFNFPINEQYHSFAWTFNENFVSGYKGQYMVYMDDVCKEAKSDNTTSANMLINLVSNVGSNVSGAAVSEKVNPFSSKLIMSTTNDSHPNGQSLNLKTPQAFWRRRNMLVEMVTAPCVDPHLGRAVSFNFLDPCNPKSGILAQCDFISLYRAIVRDFTKHYKKELELSDMEGWAENILSHPLSETYEPSCNEENPYLLAKYNHMPKYIEKRGISYWEIPIVLSNDPKLLIALSFIMTEDRCVVDTHFGEITLLKIKYYEAKSLFNNYGWDLHRAVAFAKRYAIPFDIEPAHVIDVGKILEWKRGSLEVGTAKRQGLYPFNTWNLEVFEPSSLIDEGTMLRVRVLQWCNSISKWHYALGFAALGVALLALGKYAFSHRSSPSYSATNLFCGSTSKHDEYSAFGLSHQKNVHYVGVDKFHAVGFMYKGKSMLTVSHTFAKAVDNVSGLCVIINGVPYMEVFDAKRLHKLSQSSDLCVYHFSNKKIPLAPDSRSVFSDRIHKTQMDVEVLGIGTIEKKNAQVGGSFSYKDANGDTILQRESLDVSGTSLKGSSGSIMVAMGINKIIGVQVAISQVRTRFEHVTKDMLPIESEDKEVFESSSYSDNMPLIKTTTQIVSQSVKTKIEPSKISSFLTSMFATMFVPSVLSKNDPRYEGSDDVLIKSMSGYDHPFSTLFKNVKRKVVEDFSYEDAIIRKGSKRLLSLPEMINGSEELNVKPFEISTAPGIPWCFSAKMKGKRDHISGDVPNRVYSEELRNAIENYDFSKDVLGYACLKDELRTIDKIKIGKTRSFIVLPMEFNLILRQYFGAYIGVQHRLAGSISSCVGVNPYVQWDELYVRLARCSDQWEDFDYSDWDRTLAPEWFEIYAERVSNWYNDGPYNRAIRIRLMQQLAFSHVQVKDKIYATGGGNKSGCAITAEINTDIHEMLMYYCWLELAKTYSPQQGNFSEFRRCNEFLLYGDDQVKATRDADWFNGNNLLPLMKVLGMKITPADKGELIFRPKNPEDIQFLKRNFGQRVGPGMMRCPLLKSSIIKMVHYVHKSDNPDHAIKMNIDCALKEMFFHGQEAFDEFQNVLKVACIQANLNDIPLWSSWEDLDQMWQEGILEPPTYW